MFKKTMIIDKSKTAEAKRLLENEVLNEIYDNLESTYIQTLLETPVKDTEARERLYQAIHILRIVKKHLQDIVDDGKIKEKEIAHLNRLRTK